MQKAARRDAKAALSFVLFARGAEPYGVPQHDLPWLNLGAVADRPRISPSTRATVSGYSNRLRRATPAHRR